MFVNLSVYPSWLVQPFTGHTPIILRVLMSQTLGTAVNSKDGSEMTSKRTFSCVNCFLNICFCVSQHQKDKKKTYTWEPVFHSALTADSGLGVKRTSKHT